ARIGAISESNTFTASGSRGRAGFAPGSGTDPSPRQISTPEMLAAPPSVVSRTEPPSAATRQGPSFFHVPAGPLLNPSTTSRPSRKMLNTSGLLSSHTYRNTEYVPAGISVNLMSTRLFQRLDRIIRSRSASVGGISVTV